MDITTDLVNSYCASVVESEQRFTDALRLDTDATLARFADLRSGQNLLIARGTVADRSAAELIAILGRDVITSLRNDYLWCTGQLLRRDTSTRDLLAFLTHDVINKRHTTRTTRRLFATDAATWVEDTWRRHHNGTLTTLRLPDTVSLDDAPSHLHSVKVAFEYSVFRSAAGRRTPDEIDADIAAESEATERRRRQDEFDWEHPDGRTYREGYDPNITVTVSGIDDKMMTQSLAEEKRLIRILKGKVDQSTPSVEE
ncbi:hypothetical protein [Corynebacterium variabile]|uniref:hypothetical protein n=1 Tax=Corynebacterium variabile TaxID=1727 RepID=UPI0028A25B66|nr:hypothetical protein [Corynebacterium variabile]